MSTRIFGYCFARDSMRPDNMPPGMDGYKRVLLCSVVFVPDDFDADEKTYEISADISPIDIEEQFFGGGAKDNSKLTLNLQNPKSIIDPKNGYRIDQILVTPNLWIPPGLQEREWEQES